MDSSAIELLHKKVNDAIFDDKPYQEDFLKLYRLSAEENYYWQYCPFDVWKSVVERVKEENYKKDYPDATDTYFYKNELDRLKRYKGNITYSVPMEIASDSIFHENQVFVYFDMEDYKLIGGIGLNFEDRTRKLLSNSYNKKIAYLLNKINPQSEEIFENTDSIPLDNSFPEIFKEGAYPIFYYLNENYTKDDRFRVTKYSNLFHFLSYQQMLICTGLEYIAFIKNQKYSSKMSKILVKTSKYEEKTFAVLNTIFKRFPKKPTN